MGENVTTFIIGLLILVFGGALYGKFCEKLFGIDDRTTCAYSKEDGIDYVPMPLWKNSLIQLLNIAGTGPILGPLMGILFGPVAFIAIPVGCVLSGAVHDYMSGMISMRENGAQMPNMIRKYMGKGVFGIYNILVCIVLLLVGAVFVYTPGDIFVSQILGQSTAQTNPTVWIVYGMIFVYYLIATLFPIDKVIGRLYPLFGAVLLISAIGVFFGLFLNGNFVLENLTFANLLGNFTTAGKTNTNPLVPIFFVTVACGITSGFHSTQSTLISRTIKSERQGRMAYFNMMLAEGFIAMVWAAAGMGLYKQLGFDAKLVGTAPVIGIIARQMLGPVGGLIAIIGIIVLPITSGDTGLRALRLIIGETLKIDQKKLGKRLGLSAVIFVIVALILYWAKSSASGFSILWRYFAWSNQTLATFTFGLSTVYLIVANKRKNAFLVALLPGSFYLFTILTFILNSKIGFNLPWIITYPLGGVLTLSTVLWEVHHARKLEKLGAVAMA